MLSASTPCHQPTYKHHACVIGAVWRVERCRGRCAPAGGLLDELREGQVEGAIVMRGPSTFGLPPKEAPGSILRRQVWVAAVHPCISCLRS